jgi:phosphoribosylamine--glycine ligase
VEIALVSADDPLAAGVVDALLGVGVPTVGPTRAGARIEWDKTIARELVHRTFPDANPRYAIVREPADLDAAFAAFSDIPLAVKPAGLSGGKGVKVMGRHLHNHAEARNYAAELLARGPQPRAVVVEERIDALEFTIQAITDGTNHVFPPATFDYPYRLDGDTGPGTGGMGCYTLGPGPLPFMTQRDYNDACDIIRAVLSEWREQGHQFSGVLNPGFFLTGQGLRVIEFNARFGDPEALNIMALLETDLTEMIENISHQCLSELDIRFSSDASLITYLVAPSYPNSAEPIEFDFDTEAPSRYGCTVHFAACEQLAANHYRTVSASRVLGLVTTCTDLADAHDRTQRAIESAFQGDPTLEWRTDIGSPQYIERQRAVRNSIR